MLDEAPTPPTGITGPGWNAINCGTMQCYYNTMQCYRDTMQYYYDIVTPSALMTQLMLVNAAKAALTIASICVALDGILSVDSWGVIFSG